MAQIGILENPPPCVPFDINVVINKFWKCHYSIIVESYAKFHCDPIARNREIFSCDEPGQFNDMDGVWDTGSWFNINMASYQYRKSHCGDKTVVRSSYLHNGISYTGKMTSLYWIRPQVDWWLSIVQCAVFPISLIVGQCGQRMMYHCVVVFYSLIDIYSLSLFSPINWLTSIMMFAQLKYPY